MSVSKIEWTDETWNPTTGCDRVSAGCDNCYALTMAKRLKGMRHHKYQTDGRPETSGPGFGVQTHGDTLDEPLRWRKPRRVFVNSMSDLFHPQVQNEFIVKVWITMALARRHTFQVLTKRPQRMRSLLRDPKFDRELYYGLDEYVASDSPHRDAALDLLCAWESGEPHIPNVWLGVSAEDQEQADKRVPLLLDTPAAVRFVSAEPLLGPVDLTGHLATRCPCVDRGPVYSNVGDPDHDGSPDYCDRCDDTGLIPAGLHWVIVGGESGPGARPMDLAWARSLVEQCRDARVACFVKQLGSAPSMHDATAQSQRRGKGGDPDGWPADLRVREFPPDVRHTPATMDADTQSRTRP